MQNPFRIVLKMLTVSLFAAELVSCNQFRADIETDFAYWTQQAMVTQADFTFVADAETVPSVHSKADAVLTLKVRDPQSYTLIMPSAASAPQDIIVFDTPTQPQLGTDYTLEQIDANNLRLTYKKDFLQKNEYGRTDLGATITLYDSTGRKFAESHSFKLRCNTPPPEIGEKGLCKTTGSPSYYAFYLEVPEMADQLMNGELMHKDVAKIIVNSGTKEESYGLGVENDDFKKPSSESFITRADVEKMDSTSKEIPARNWMLFYNTGIQVRSGQGVTGYSFYLTDLKGLKSAKTTGSITQKKAQAAQIALKPDTGTVLSGTVNADGSTAADPIQLRTAAGQPGVTLTASSGTPGAKIHYTLTELPATFAGIAKETNSPCDIALEQNKSYKLEVYATADGFTDSETRTFYYKIDPADVCASVVMTLRSGTGDVNADGSSTTSPIKLYPNIGNTRVTLTASCVTHGATVFYRLTEGTTPAGSFATISADGITLEQNKSYKLEVYATAQGFTQSSTRTFFYSVGSGKST
ncbi:hypothetical protein [Treponema phagedenis]|uniref:hypothetical protein n=1 Tax=Treponema phagedenis TaxID=162 RepID=UPI001581FEE2|nr:hypothetical protein [Treponema phagedenis]QKS93139.1 hypothetical protein HPJ96_11695 [Treponema phagedenis]